MRKAAMMSKSINRALETKENVEIGRFCGKRHGCGGERSLAIESCARQDRSGQEVGEWFQRKVLTQEELRATSGEQRPLTAHRYIRFG